MDGKLDFEIGHTQPQFASMNCMLKLCPNPEVMLQLFVYLYVLAHN